MTAKGEAEIKAALDALTDSQHCLERESAATRATVAGLVEATGNLKDAVRSLSEKDDKDIDRALAVRKDIDDAIANTVSTEVNTLRTELYATRKVVYTLLGSVGTLSIALAVVEFFVRHSG